jgi:hypothetical protein
VGEWLRGDVQGSLRGPAAVRSELYFRAAAGLWAAVTGGGTAFEREYGAAFFDHLDADPEAAAQFQGSMAGRAAYEAGAVVAAYDFGALATLVDVGGGPAIMLSAILRSAPRLRAVLVDRPGTLPAARARLEADGVAGRAECLAGDFFAELPAGADGYLLARVLHDWDDDAAARILAVCKAAMGPGARLLVAEAILPERAADQPEAIRMDLHMLLLLGARERTEAEFRALLAGAGFEVAAVAPTGAPSGLSVLEAVVR